MRMQKGICIELDGDRSVYMLADGRFVTGRPQKGTAVGEEAFFESLSTTPTTKRRRATMFTMPIIATVAILMLVFSMFMMPEQEAYGYVQVESNPGIELALDDERQVISVRELNADGRQLIEQLDEWENGTLEDVLKNVLALSISDATEQVTITTVQEQGDTKTISTVEQITLAALTDNADKTLHIHLKEANKEQWRQAKEQQVPVGQFAKNNRTYSSPASEDNEVQPARNGGEEIEKADGKSGQAGESEQENSDVDSRDAQPDDPSSAKPSNDAGNTQPVPAEKPKPAAPTENKSNKHESKPQAPATKKDDAKPSPAQPKNPNAGKGNNPTPGKSKTAPGKKEIPADHKSNENQKTPQPNKDNKLKDQPQDKQSNNGNNSISSNSSNSSNNSNSSNSSNKGNGDPKGKNISEENKTKNPQNNAPPKSEKLENGKGQQNNNNSPSGSTDGKANTPHSEKKAGKDDAQ